MKYILVKHLLFVRHQIVVVVIFLGLAEFLEELRAHDNVHVVQESIQEQPISVTASFDNGPLKKFMK